MALEHPAEQDPLVCFTQIFSDRYFQIKLQLTPNLGPPGPGGQPGQPGGPGTPGQPGSSGQPGHDAAYCPCPSRTGATSGAAAGAGPKEGAVSGSSGSKGGSYKSKARAARKKVVA